MVAVMRAAYLHNYNNNINSLDVDSETTRHATEQPQLDENEPPALNAPEQDLAYVIVNAFLDNVTFESTEAEPSILEESHGGSSPCTARRN